MTRPSPFYYDCQHCGACCFNTPQNQKEGYRDYIEVLARDPLRKKPELMRKLVILNDDGEAHMRLDGEGRCLALKGKTGKHVWCSIYYHRPTPCRRVEPGSDLCLHYRTQMGMSES